LVGFSRAKPVRGNTKSGAAAVVADHFPEN
jgi:hypothetical protein